MEDDLEKIALNAIKQVFDDTSVDAKTTKERLEALRDEIDLLLGTL